MLVINTNALDICFAKNVHQDVIDNLLAKYKIKYKCNILTIFVYQAAIDNLEAMLDPSLGVDAVLIGPHDLSCNLGDY